MRFLVIVAIFCFSNAYAQETNTAMGFTLSPGFSAPRYISDGTLTEEQVQEVKALESGKLGLSGDMFFQYALSDHIFLNWGLGLQYQGYQSSIYTESDAVNESVTRSAKYSQYYIQIHTSAKFRIYRMLYVRVGAGINLLAEAREKVEESCETGDYSHIGEDNRNYRGAMGVTSLGIGYELKLRAKLNLVTEIFGSTGFTSATSPTTTGVLTNNIPLDRIPMQVGITLGVIKYF